ncbi:uncharacterized protein JN550_000027 [Neoarthrinium moseri]|uniref:uncharacterized protein n=1 Tax=Neoarthrinium moseri TaxID=1658444 RepID=UPI001FDC6D3D|nr:uncharacterized protein JN550_000027 [Neoarthrinium moseri]KAI1877845.1 hypothetical protein JN550_000027 [Neoarthrinium moseri]
MSSALERQSNRLTRAHSLDAAQNLDLDSDGYALGQVLRQGSSGESQVYLADPWRRFYEWEEPPPEHKDPLTQVISTEAKMLINKWIHFRDQCPKDDQLDLEDYEPNMESVLLMVERMNSRWNSDRESGKGGKTKKLFHSACETLDAHSSIMKMLPNGNEYVSIFTGALNTVIQASVNHESIAGILSEALDASLRNRVIDCNLDLEIFKTEEMLKLVADLYASLFALLSDIMDWLMLKWHKRMLRSFNEKCGKKFEGMIEHVKVKADNVKRKAEQSSRAEGRVTRLLAERTLLETQQMRLDLRIGREGEARRLAELTNKADRLSQQTSQDMIDRREQSSKIDQIHSYLIALLQSNAGAYIISQENDSGLPSSVSAQLLMASGHLNVAKGIAEMPTSRYMADDVAINSAQLEDYFSRDRVRLPHDPQGPIVASQETIRRLVEFTGEKSPHTLWIDGSAMRADDTSNPLTAVSMKFIHLNAQFGVPVISYFCQLSRSGGLLPGNTREMQGLIALCYSLTRQMIELLLSTFESNADFSGERFARLDGTASSWEEWVALFGDLVEEMPNRLFCVIDGVHLVDDRSTENYMGELITVLANERLRVLFTTTGRSPTLRREIGKINTLSLNMNQFSRGGRLNVKSFGPEVQQGR